MRWDFGLIYRQIRKSKGLTQEQVCGGWMSLPALSKIEQGKSMPNFENMLFLLNQINMTVEEFSYICHRYRPNERQSIINQTFDFQNWYQISEMKKLRTQCQTYLKAHHDLPISHIEQILTLLIEHSEVTTNSVNKNAIADNIWHFLEKEDDWYESDFYLVNAILPYLPSEAVVPVTNRVFRSIAKYKDYRRFISLQINLFTTLSELLLRHDQLIDCQEVCFQLLSLGKHYKRYDAIAIATVRLGICQKNPTKAREQLDIFRLIDDRSLQEKLLDDIEAYLE